MLNDQDLARTLRSALPPVRTMPHSRDLWADVVERTRRRPRVSTADWSVAAVVVLALLMFPKVFWFLAYHL